MRHTTATWLENADFDLYSRSLVLNHSLGGISQGYSQGDAMGLKLRALQAWSDHVSLII